jgi:hypothetical protein
MFRLIRTKYEYIGKRNKEALNHIGRDASCKPLHNLKSFESPLASAWIILTS